MLLVKIKSMVELGYRITFSQLFGQMYVHVEKDYFDKGNDAKAEHTSCLRISDHIQEDRVLGVLEHNVSQIEKEIYPEL